MAVGFCFAVVLMLKKVVKSSGHYGEPETRRARPDPCVERPVACGDSKV